MQGSYEPLAGNAGSDTSRPTGDVADTGEVSTGEEQSVLHPAPTLPARPPLQRDPLQALPPPIPAPDPPTNTSTTAESEPTNSLSLLQLRRIVADFHRTEPLAYDFEYSDMGPHAEEIDEWFVYQFWQWVRLNAAQRAFDWHWENENETADDQQRSWDDADNETRTRFVRAAIAGVQSNDAALRSASIGKLVYLILGRWGDTAMLNATGEDSGRSVASLSQLQAIKAGVECLASLEGLPVVWDALRSSFELQW